MHRALIGATVAVGVGGLLTFAWMTHSAATARAQERASPARAGLRAKTTVTVMARPFLEFPAQEEPTSGPRSALTYEQRLESDASFQDFVKAASLSETQAHTLAHILALFYLNDEAIDAAGLQQGEAAIAAMRRQLRGDTFAQVRVRLPEGGWEKLVHSGLLPDATEDSTTPR